MYPDDLLIDDDTGEIEEETTDGLTDGLGDMGVIENEGNILGFGVYGLIIPDETG